MIQHLLLENVPVLYFFFRHSLDTNNSPEALLRDWLVQTLKYSPPLQHALSARVRQSPSKQDLSLSELWSFLRRALMYLPKVYCVIDAMDEMDPERLEPLVKSLDALGRWRPAEIKLVVTSRPIPVVERIFSRGVKTLDVRLDKKNIENDIVRYVQHRLSSSPVPPERREGIENAIIQRADGLFLYAKLALDSLLQPGTSLPTKLAEMPADLTKMYTSFIQDHSNKTAKAPAGLLEFVLQLVTHATRALRLIEIADLVRITHLQGDLGDTKSLIRLLCGPLLEILPDETVRVVHHSLTEYLKGMTSTSDTDMRIFPVFSCGATNHRLAMACLSYLTSGCLESVQYKQRRKISGDVNYTEPASLKANLVLPPSTLYAGTNWAIHMRRGISKGQDPTDIHDMLDKLLIEPNLDKLEVLANTRMDFQPTPLHFAIGLGLQEYASHLLSKRKTEYIRDGRLDDSLILYATYQDSEFMVKLLLDHGADLNSTNEQGRTTLHIAAEHDFAKAAAVFMRAGSSIEVARGEDNYFGMPGEAEPPWTPLERVFSRGGREMTKLFFKGLKSPGPVSEALYYAICGRNTYAIELLLQHPDLDINKAHRDGSPLLVASVYRDVSMIELLLRSGAAVKEREDISSRDQVVARYAECVSVLAGDGAYSSALHAWAGGSHHLGDRRPRVQGEEMAQGVRILLSYGADVGQVNERGDTPLHLANDVGIARALLEGGANPNATNRRGETLLHISHSLEILEVLLPRADLNLQALDTKRTPLLHTLAEEYTRDRSREKALRLIESGANVNAVDKHGNSALHYAAGMGDVGTALVDKLLASGVSINVKNHQGKAPLHMIVQGSGNGGTYDSRRPNATVFDALMAAGADINARDNRGATVLFQYIENANSYPEGERSSWFTRFVQAGVKTDTVDSGGRSLLHAQVFNVDCGDASLLELIRDSGVDPSHVDHDGNTLFHEAAPKLAKMAERTRAPLLAHKLTEMGVDAFKPNHDGRTPLHIIASTNPDFFDRLQSRHSGRSGLKKAAEGYGVDLYLRLYPDSMDGADKHGVRPLHIASTFSEYLTRRLLDEGASPSEPTIEGLTPFHLAARSQQANIIGILLDKLRSTSTPEAVTAVLNMKDNLNRTALYYAAASGRAQSFQLLLGAGASLNHDVYAGSAWNGCADFEEELSCWSSQSTQDDRILCRQKFSMIYIDAGGVTISDTSRPSLHKTRRSERVMFFSDGLEEILGPSPHEMTRSERFLFPTERLEEILDTLVASAPKRQIGFVDQAIAFASEKHNDYTVERLFHAREQLIGNAQGAIDKTTKVLHGRKEIAVAEENTTRDTILCLMRSRSYAEVFGTLNPANSLYSDSRGTQSSLVSELVLNGFTTLASKAISECVEEQGQEIEPDESRIEPFLITACSAEMPNMDVIRMLVEDKKVDVNEAMFERDYYGLSKSATALHVLAEGIHWWQSAQAIPYLLQHGADLEAEVYGLTPLGYALRNINLPQFSKRAVEALLASGASPNKSDKSGGSYLSWTIKHPEMFHALVQKGATITRSTLEAAIDQQDMDVIQMLLSNGADPNQRKVGEERAMICHSENSFSPARKDPNSREELYLIDWLATEQSWREEEKKEVDNRIIRMLLEHGADPFAPYLRTTVLHRVLENRGLNTSSGGQNRHLDLLLDQPDLDLDTRDGDGMTLLLLETKKRSGGSDESSMRVMQKLLDLGADIHARDNSGRSAMHYGAHSQKRCEFFRLKAPELINSPDNDGKTPLHHALRSMSQGPYSTQFVSSGVYHAACELITDGAKVRHPDHDGKTPLHLALGRSAWHIHLDDSIGGPGRHLLHSLIDKGVDVNERTKTGETPIFDYFRDNFVAAEVEDSEQYPDTVERHWPSRRQQREMAVAVQKEGILLTLFEEHGVDLHAVSDAGQGLLHLVAKERDSDYPGRRVARFKLLMEKGLDPVMEDNDYRTPLDYAVVFGHEDILALFKRDE